VANQQRLVGKLEKRRERTFARWLKLATSGQQVGISRLESAGKE
jgi:hypothetical protein